MTDMQTITITNLHGEEEEVTVPVTLIPMEELAEEELAAGRIDPDFSSRPWDNIHSCADRAIDTLGLDKRPGGECPLWLPGDYDE